MATVWAPFIADRIGRWQDRADTAGWNRTFHFNNLTHLRDQMRAANLGGRVSRLAIVAHGDQPGVVQLNRTLNISSISSFGTEINNLRWYLQQDAQLIFMSCIAGANEGGNRFLAALSQRLPGRTIVGFTVYGLTSANETLSAMSPQTPGQITPATGLGQRISGHGTLDPWDVFAKWARNGRIIKDAPVERDEARHCANPQCPGHENPRHNCLGWP